MVHNQGYINTSRSTLTGIASYGEGDGGCITNLHFIWVDFSIRLSNIKRISQNNSGYYQ
jgi:hypothetical protein